MRHLRVIVRDDVLSSMRRSFSRILSWFCRLVTVRTEKHKIISCTKTYFGLFLNNVDTMFLFYLLSLEFVWLFSFSLLIFFCSSSFVVVRSFLSSETNQNIAKQSSTLISQPTFVLCDNLLCFFFLFNVEHKVT